MIEFQSAHPVRGATTISWLTPRSQMFQSTHPVRGATRVHALLVQQSGISIHAPRAGCDVVYTACHRVRADFNPRTPCGARQMIGHGEWLPYLFQSTRPVWGATMTRCCKCTVTSFQSTRPVWGATTMCPAGRARRRNFNPRAPCGARRGGMGRTGRPDAISIHAPRVGRDEGSWCYPAWRRCISIHAPRVGRDSKFDDFTPSNLHKRYKRVLARPKNARKKGKIK